MAKTFSLAVHFDGLLHYVENLDREKRVQLCIVLPEAPNHVALIRPMDGCSMTVAGEPRLCREFSGHRVAFELTWDKPVKNSTFDFERAVMVGEPKAAVPLEAMIKGCADHNPSIVGVENLAESNVRAQVLIGKEALFSVPEIKSRRPRLRFANGEVVRMAPFVSMSIAGLTSARVVLLPLDAGAGELPSYLDIVPEEGDVAELAISHICPPQEKEEKEGRDEDFVYHYALLQQRDDDRRTSGAENDFPVPEILDYIDDVPLIIEGILPEELPGKSGESPVKPDSKEDFLRRLCSKKAKKLLPSTHLNYTRTGSNCAPARGLPREFNLDEEFEALTTNLSAASEVIKNERKSAVPRPSSLHRKQ